VVTDETDNCSNTTVAFVSDVSDGNSCSETINRTYSITDDCGNTATVTQQIIINDTIAPTASNPANIVVECIQDIPNPDINVVTDEADNCAAPTVTFISDISDGNSCSETINRTYRVTDNCGNSIDVIQQIIINDVTLPTASNPPSITVECNDDIPNPNINIITDEADNCSIPTVAFVSDVSNGNSCSEIINRTYSITDDCGNSINVVQQIIINDITPPTASNPPTISVQCIDDVPNPDISIVTDEADNCGAPIVAFISDVSDGNSCSEIITRTFSVTDDCGNSITVAQQIVIDDTEAPELLSTIENEVFVSCSPIPDAPELEFTDNCSQDILITYTETINTTGNLSYEIIREWIASDDCDNERSIIQTVFVTNDVTLDTPSLNLCIEDESINLNSFITNTDSLEGTWDSETLDVLNGTILNPANLEQQDYIFTYLYEEDDCSWVTQLTISVDDDCVDYPCIVSSEDITISKLVTPNNDGFNDTFSIEWQINEDANSDCHIIPQVKIFNRWGTKVYQSDDYDNTWNGQSPSSSVGNSDTLPTGTYYYIVELVNSGRETLQGYIYLGTN